MVANMVVQQLARLQQEDRLDAAMPRIQFGRSAAANQDGRFVRVRRAIGHGIIGIGEWIRGGVTPQTTGLHGAR